MDQEEKTLTSTDGAIVSANTNTSITSASSSSSPSSSSSSNTGTQGYDYNALTSTLGTAIPQSLTAFSGAFQEYQKTKQKMLESTDKMMKGIISAANTTGTQVVALQKRQSEMIDNAMNKFTDLCDTFTKSILESSKEIKQDLKLFQDSYDTARVNLEKYPDSKFWQDQYTKAEDVRNNKHSEIIKYVAKTIKGHRDSLESSQKNFNSLVITLELSNNELIREAFNLQKQLIALATEVCSQLTGKKIELPAPVTPEGSQSQTLASSSNAPSTNSQGSAQTNFFDRNKWTTTEVPYLQKAAALVKSAKNDDDMFIADRATELDGIIRGCMKAKSITDENRADIDDAIKFINDTISENKKGATCG